MIVGLTGDLHLRSNFNFRQRCASLGKITTIFKNEKVDLICLLGDLAGFDAPHRLTYDERNFLAYWIRCLSEIAPVLIIRGNHDTFNDIAVFSHVGATNPVFVYGSVASYLAPEANFVLAPFTQTTDWNTQDADEAKTKLLAAVREQIKPNQTNILLGHYLLEGALAGDFEITSVKDITLDEDFLSSSGVDHALFGHIHSRQGRYVGSPYQTSFGESSDGKGVVILDTHGMATKIVPIEDDFKLKTITATYKHEALLVNQEDWEYIRNKQLCDNTRFKLKLTSDESSIYKVPLQDLQTIIMGFGGFFSIDDVVLLTEDIESVKIKHADLLSPQKHLIEKMEGDKIKLARLEALSESIGIGLWTSTT